MLLRFRYRLLYDSITTAKQYVWLLKINVTFQYLGFEKLSIKYVLGLP
jgi:hypothetical protein